MRRIAINAGMIALTVGCVGWSATEGSDVPPISFDDVLFIVNRPLDNVHEWAYGGPGFCTEDVPIIQLSTNEIKMFLENYVPNFGSLNFLPGSFPDANYAKYKDLESRGVIFTKSGRCYHWDLHMMRNLDLSTETKNYAPLYVTNDWAPKRIVKVMKHTELRPPSSNEVVGFWNAPSSRIRRIRRINCPRGQILSFLDQSKSREFIKRCDALKPLSLQSMSEKGNGIGRTVYKRDGVLLCNDKRVVFWELLSDDKLFLEDADGASCLLCKH